MSSQEQDRTKSRTPRTNVTGPVRRAGPADPSQDKGLDQNPGQSPEAGLPARQGQNPGQSLSPYQQGQSDDEDLGPDQIETRRQGRSTYGQAQSPADQPTPGGDYGKDQ